MSKMKNGLHAISSLIGLSVRRICGGNISFPLVTLVSSHASIKTSKKGTIRIGRRTAVSLNTLVHASRGGVVTLGSRVFVNRNCMIVAHKKIQIGEGTTIGPNVCVYDHDHDGDGGYICKDVIIGNNVWIGAGSIILKGVTLVTM